MQPTVRTLHAWLPPMALSYILALSGSPSVAHATQATQPLNAVTDFGAVGDGKTDNSSALIAGLSAAWQAHAELYIPCGTYDFSQPLAIYFGSTQNTNVDGFTIKGENPECTRLVYTGTTSTPSAIIVSAYGPFNPDVDPNATTSGLIVEDLYVEGNANSADALTIVEAVDSSFRNIHAGAAQTNGIHFWGTEGSTMDLLTVSSVEEFSHGNSLMPKNCINLDGWQNSRATTTVTLIEPNVTGCPGWGLLLSVASTTTVSGLQADLDGTANTDSGTLKIVGGPQSDNNVILQGLFGEQNPSGTWGIEDDGFNDTYVGPVAYPVDLGGRHISIFGGLIGTITDTGADNRVVDITSCQPGNGPVFGSNTDTLFQMEQVNQCSTPNSPLPDQIPNVVNFGTASGGARLNGLGPDSGAGLWLQYVDGNSYYDSAKNAYFRVNGNSGTSTALTLLANGDVGVGTSNPGALLQVGSSGDGTVAIANGWQTFSDRRLKKQLARITDAEGIVDHLNGYYFRWKNPADPGRQVGVVAQEVEKALPEVVATTPAGLKSVDYSRLTAVLIEAFKELQGQVRSQQDEIAALKHELSAAEASRPEGTSAVH